MATAKRRRRAVGASTHPTCLSGAGGAFDAGGCLTAEASREQLGAYLAGFASR